MTAPVVNGDRRAAAVEHYRAALVAGEHVSGAELGRRFGMSPSWGRHVAASVRPTIDTISESESGGDGSRGQIGG
jgi:hypothetical protein